MRCGWVEPFIKLNNRYIKPRQKHLFLIHCDKKYVTFIVLKIGIMRKVFLFLLVLVAFTTSQAQKAKTTIPKSILVFPDTSIFLHSFPNYNRLKYTTDNMPNPLKGMDNQLTKIGSNNKGFDLYQSKLDNMIVLKPDNQNLASNYIPNALKTLPAFLQKPDLKGLPKLNALVDSLAHTK
jgi:hypothetical protein